jgi:hypothetical protein
MSLQLSSRPALEARIADWVRFVRSSSVSSRETWVVTVASHPSRREAADCSNRSGSVLR